MEVLLMSGELYPWMPEGPELDLSTYVGYCGYLENGWDLDELYRQYEEQQRCKKLGLPIPEARGPGTPEHDEAARRNKAQRLQVYHNSEEYKELQRVLQRQEEEKLTQERKYQERKSVVVAIALCAVLFIICKVIMG
ncbi:MAG: hypothetical protein LBU84_17780 [Prevotella sp.]|jgi:hypothetical protein|nr:hypothetical protein [Prevotella sp.]